MSLLKRISHLYIYQEMEFMKLFSTFLLLFSVFTAGLSAMENFEDGTSANWNALNSQLSVSGVRYKEGKKSLHWSWTAQNAELQFKMAETSIPKSGVFGMWVHAPKSIDGRMIVQFRYQRKLVAEVWYNMNCTGWRALGADYSLLGLSEKNKIDEILIIPPREANSGEYFFDMVSMTVPGKKPQGDAQQPWANQAEILQKPFSETVFSTHDIALNRPFLPAFVPEQNITADTRKEMETVALRVFSNLSYVGDQKYGQFSQLETAFSELGIQEHNGIVTGPSIIFDTPGSIFFPIPESLGFSQKIIPLFRQLCTAYHQEKDENKHKAAQMFILLCRHFLDQGFQEGNGNLGINEGGYGSRGFASTLFRMRTELEKVGLLDSVMKSTSWISGGQDSMSPSPTSHCDMIYNTTCHLLPAILLIPDLAERYQRLRAAKRYYDKIIEAAAPFAPDGAIHHHWGHHIAYGGYGPETMMTTQIKPLARTMFAIGPVAHEKLRRYVLANHIQSVKGHIAPNLYLRAGTPYSLNVKQSSLSMALSGSPDRKSNVDTLMAGVYINIINNPKDKYFQIFEKAGIKPVEPNGHLTLNTAGLAIHRKGNWQVSAAGMMNSFRCHEIYGWLESNNYGVFARNGSIFVTNGEDCGFRYDGWNHCFWPGATTVIRPSADLYEGYTMPGGGTYFGGGVTFGQNGVWGNEFQNRGIKFRKSAFFFDRIILVVTSGIERQNTKSTPIPTEEIVTTLFQEGIDSKHPAISINGNPITTFPFQETRNDNEPLLLHDGRGNGYYIEPGTPVHISSSEQSWIYMFKRYLLNPGDNPCIDIRKKLFKEKPMSANEKYYKPSVGPFNLAYFNHGTDPKNAKCTYILLPECTERELTQFARAMKSGQKPVRMIQSTDEAHAAFDPKSKTYAYVVFDPKATFPAISPVQKISHPAFLAVRDAGNAYYIALGISDIRVKDKIKIELKGVKDPVEIDPNYPVNTEMRVPKN